VVVWHQWPKGKIEGGMPEALLNDICVQRLDEQGSALWQQNGVSLNITEVAEYSLPHNLKIASDSSGGAIIIWEDMRHVPEISIYAQRVNAEGEKQWTDGGTPVCRMETGSSLMYELVSDGAGGILIGWWYNDAESEDKGKMLRIQRLDSTGTIMWEPDGLPVSVDIKGQATAPVVAADGRGGALITWGVGKYQYEPDRSYVQRIDAKGRRVWGDEGILLGHND
ncbi:MAG: hypothetical protein SVM79_09100, partial [Chloroflexota bacterium]|nr:hypothetical protein [Chloroflexota bacterium]